MVVSTQTKRRICKPFYLTKKVPECDGSTIWGSGRGQEVGSRTFKMLHYTRSKN